MHMVYLGGLWEEEYSEEREKSLRAWNLPTFDFVYPAPPVIRVWAAPNGYPVIPQEELPEKVTRGEMPPWGWLAWERAALRRAQASLRDAKRRRKASPPPNKKGKEKAPTSDTEGEWEWDPDRESFTPPQPENSLTGEGGSLGDKPH